MKISLIAAISENYVLAKNGKIPWNIPTDYKRYMNTIKDHVIISGRRTFGDSFKETVNIVITRDKLYKPPIEAYVVNSVEEALLKAKRTEVLRRAKYRDEIFIIGGGEIFKETITLANKIYLTIIHKQIDGDTFFPDYSAFKKIIYKKELEENGYSFTFLDLEH